MYVLESDLDIMEALKAATRERHSEAEHLMPFFQDRLSIEIYGETLISFLGLFEPLEDKLSSMSGWQSAGVDPTRRLRASLRRTDLRALGVPESIVASSPRCRDLPELNDCFSGLGCLYVLEGSTLGGQLIARELDRRLGIDERSGTCGPQWLRKGADTRSRFHSGIWCIAGSAGRGRANQPDQQQYGDHLRCRAYGTGGAENRDSPGREERACDQGRFQFRKLERDEPDQDIDRTGWNGIFA